MKISLSAGKYLYGFLILLLMLLLLTDAASAGWEKAPEILSQIREPVFSNREFDIRDYGALGDGITDSSFALSKAIEACSRAGGGRVTVPAGVYLTGAVHLKSNVNLHLLKGAVLRFIPEPERYLPAVYTRWEGVECMNYSSLIYAYGQENIAVTGAGILDGQADNKNWWPWCGSPLFGADKGSPGQAFARKRLFKMGEDNVPVKDRIFGKDSFLRPNFIQFYKCKNILVEGITLNNSPMWQIHPVLCSSVTVRGVSLVSHGPNNDGCNPESCSYVLIEDCYFDTGDDCIAVKSGRNNDGRRVGAPSENIIIRNCRMKDGHGGVTIGSEASGGVRNIFAENCVMDSPSLNRALRLKTNSVRGGFIENIFMRNVTVGEVSDAVLRINLFYEEGDAGEFPPRVQNIEMKNVTSRKSRYGLYIRGYKDNPVRNIHILGCEFGNAALPDVIENVEGLVTDRKSF